MRLLAVLVLLLSLLPSAAAAELQQQTVSAFDKYVRLTEARIAREVERGPFLWFESLPAARREAVQRQLRAGEVVMERLEARDGSREIEIPDGMVHHWIGSAFIPGVTLDQVLRPMQDYDRHARLYHPEVIRSKLVRRDGNFFQAYLRFRKKKVITVETNTHHDIWYFRVSPTRVHTRSYATRIAEVEDPGTPQEKEKPIGNDSGFLWRLNSYWRLEQRDGGVFIQCEAVSLTRDIPFGTGWVVKPFVTSVPRESLAATLNLTRNAARAEGAAAAKR